MKSPVNRTILFLLFATNALAFPPAPPYTLAGTVRDQVGQTLDVDGAELILLKDGEAIGRSPIKSGLRIDQNYELKIRIDADRPSTQLYNRGAIRANGQFSLVVEMNGVRFYPIEVSHNLTVGKGGEHVRLDLNLGEDSDIDGLPDVWEQWQLFQSGHIPDENGKWDLGLIDRTGDLDGDGQNNYFEYIAGTFAGDASERFTMDIIEKTADRVRFEFFAITGKVYTIERSTDAKTWTRVPFSTSEAGVAAESYKATAVAITPAFCKPSESAKEEFYRLIVR